MIVIRPLRRMNIRQQPLGRSKTALALLVLGLIAGCGGAARPIKYYQLTSPANIAPTTGAPIPATIVINLPSASALYRDNRVVYSVGEQQLGTYEYERWSGAPPELIQEVLIRRLRATGRFAGVFTPLGKANGNYNLISRIYDFKEQDAAGNLSARLSMDFELRDAKTGNAVWEHYYTHDEPISAKTVPDVVAALDKNVQLAAGDVVTGLDQYFAAHPPN